MHPIQRTATTPTSCARAATRRRNPRRCQTRRISRRWPTRRKRSWRGCASWRRRKAHDSQKAQRFQNLLISTASSGARRTPRAAGLGGQKRRSATSGRGLVTRRWWTPTGSRWWCTTGRQAISQNSSAQKPPIKRGAELAQDGERESSISRNHLMLLASLLIGLHKAKSGPEAAHRLRLCIWRSRIQFLRKISLQV